MSLLACGFGSGLVASILTQPFDVIKTKVQVSTEPNQGIISAFRKVIRNGNGVRDLYSGLAPRVMRRTLMAAFTWLFYEEVGYHCVVCVILFISDYIFVFQIKKMV